MEALSRNMQRVSTKGKVHIQKKDNGYFFPLRIKFAAFKGAICYPS